MVVLRRRILPRAGCGLDDAGWPGGRVGRSGYLPGKYSVHSDSIAGSGMMLHAGLVGLVT